MGLLFLAEPMSLMAALCVVLFFMISSVPLGSATTEPTVYEALRQYDFPVGLLPKGVKSYDLDKSTGKFSVHLNGPCSFPVRLYKLKYDPTIKGVITKGKISSLTGVQLKVVMRLIPWLDVVKAVREGGEIHFSVQTADKGSDQDLPVSFFDESPSCGCGFSCDRNGNGSSIAL